MPIGRELNCHLGLYEESEKKLQQANHSCKGKEIFRKKRKTGKETGKKKSIEKKLTNFYIGQTNWGGGHFQTDKGRPETEVRRTNQWGKGCEPYNFIKPGESGGDF